MSDPRLARALSVLGAAAALAASPSLARADEGAPLHKDDVVLAVLAENPTVKAAVSDCRSAAFEVEAEAAHYPFSLTLNTQYTTIANPTLFPPNSVGTPTQSVFETSAALTKHLVWGTDLSLTLDGQRQTQTSVFFLPPTFSNGFASAFAKVQGVNLAAFAGLGGFSSYSVGPGYQAYVKLGATQPLLRGAGRRAVEADLRAARVNLSIAELTRDRTASQALRDALTAYWEAWYAATAVNIEQRSRETAKRQLDDANARVSTGGLARADALTFETQLAGREEDITNADAERTRRFLDLARLLGRAENPGAVRVPADEGPDAPPAVPGDLRRQAALASTDLRVLAAQIELARVQAETAGEALRPRLDLDGYVQAQGLGYDDVPSALSQLGKFGAVSAHVGLTLELPLDDTRHRMERARATLAVETATHRFDEARQSLFADLDSAVGAGVAAKRRAELAEQTRAVAARQLAAEEARFATGGSTAVQVLQAEDAVRSAELRLARARADEVQAYLRVEHLRGGLLPDVATTARQAGGAQSCTAVRPAHDPAAWRLGLF